LKERQARFLVLALIVELHAFAEPLARHFGYVVIGSGEAWSGDGQSNHRRAKQAHHEA
jgi:hypothetical protein